MNNLASLYEERDDLASRLIELQNFLEVGSKGIKNLPSDQHTLMLEQETLMSKMVVVLDKRTALLSKSGHFGARSGSHAPTL